MNPLLCGSNGMRDAFSNILHVLPCSKLRKLRTIALMRTALLLCPACLRRDCNLFASNADSQLCPLKTAAIASNCIPAASRRLAFPPSALLAAPITVDQDSNAVTLAINKLTLIGLA